MDRNSDVEEVDIVNVVPVIHRASDVDHLVLLKEFRPSVGRVRVG